MRTFQRDPPKPRTDLNVGIKAVPKEATTTKLHFIKKKK